jgi:hypothetical protein
MTKHTVPVRVVCVDPPAPPPGYDAVEFGLQDKDRALLSGTANPDGSLIYAFTLDVRRHDDGTPNFTGTFAHGSRAERFLYLSQPGLKGGTWAFIKRIKIPLKSITWAQVQAVLAGEDAALEVTVSGQGMATVPLLGDGWTVHHT